MRTFLKHACCWLIAATILSATLSLLHAQEQVRLEIVEVDTSAFPEITITVLTAEEGGARLSNPSRLVVQENGLPVEDLSFGNTANGTDIVFVIDANEAIGVADDDTELTRLEKVRESISRFATQYMNRDGLDRVTVVVPHEDGNQGAFLIQDVSDPNDVISAIDAYNPIRTGPTPLNAMVSTAVSHAQQGAEQARFRAILLFTDARRISEQLSYPLLVAQANDASTPVYVAILGAQADEGEIDNASRLFEPTNGAYVHMPQGVESDPIYEVWQAQGDPITLRYRSSQRQSGRNQIIVTLDDQQASASFDIDLSVPTIQVELEATEITRTGDRHDTLLGELSPSRLPLTVRVEWSDELPRRLTDVMLLINGRPLSETVEFQDLGEGEYSLLWDIQEQGAGTVTLEVQVTDELGYQGASDPLEVSFSIEQPGPPTEPPPTQSAPSTAPAVDEVQSSLPWTLALIPLILIVAVVGLLIWLRRRRKRRVDEAKKAFDSRLYEDKEAEPLAGRIAYLQPVREGHEGQILLLSENIIIGRDESRVTVKLDDPSISPLHARIRRREESHWLFDEGSTEGTTLNYEQLGLAPRRLSHDDIVGFGKLLYRFRYRYPQSDASLGDYNYQITREESEDVTNEG